MPAEELSSFDTGYIIGLIVGEGSFTGDRTYPALSVKMHARDPSPLGRLRELLGGRVYGPYNHDKRRYFVWLLRGDELCAAIPLLRDYLPPSWKRLQFERWLLKYEPFLSRRALSALPTDEAPDPDAHTR